jgi:hypothetical protein
MASRLPMAAPEWNEFKIVVAGRNSEIFKLNRAIPLDQAIRVGKL